MGVDVGAYKKYETTEYGDVVFFDSKERLKYPNGEFTDLALLLMEMTGNKINLFKYLINDDIYDCDNPKEDNTRIFNHVKNLDFKDAVETGDVARCFIKNNYEDIKNRYDYSFRHDPLEVIEYLIQLWKDGYYVTYCY